MPVMFQDGAPLFRDGELAMSVDCCCGCSCEGRTLPTTLFASLDALAGAGGAACPGVDGETIQLDFNGTDAWIGERTLDCGDTVRLILACAPRDDPTCQSMTLRIIISNAGGEVYDSLEGRTPEADCTCNPLVLVFDDGGLQLKYVFTAPDCCTFGSGGENEVPLIVTVTE